MTATIAKLKPTPAIDAKSALDNRAALRAAIANRNAAVASVRSATETASRGQTLLARAEAELAKLGDVENAVTAHRAGKIKQFATNGGPEPDMSLPHDLIERRAARDEARDHVAATKAVVDALMSELQAAESVLGRAEFAVSTAARNVVIEEAGKLGEQLSDLWTRVWVAADQLQAIAGLWLPNPPAGPKTITLPWSIIEILNAMARADFRQFPAGQNPHRERAGDAWRQWYGALCLDAEAVCRFDGS